MCLCLCKHKHLSIQETGKVCSSLDIHVTSLCGLFPLSNPPPRALNSLCSPEVLLKRVCFCRGPRRTLAPGPCSEQTSSLVSKEGPSTPLDQPKKVDNLDRLKDFKEICTVRWWGNGHSLKKDSTCHENVPRYPKPSNPDFPCSFWEG